MSLATLDWAVSSGAGLMAFGLLTLSVALGLTLAMRASSPAWSRGLITEAHRYPGALGPAANGLHLLTL